MTSNENFWGISLALIEVRLSGEVRRGANMPDVSSLGSSVTLLQKITKDPDESYV